VCLEAGLPCSDSLQGTIFTAGVNGDGEQFPIRDQSSASEKGPLPQGATVWLSQNIRWQHAPKEYSAELQYGSGIILYFRQDGKFGRLKCVLNRVGQRINVSLGDTKSRDRCIQHVTIYAFK
jgi:hypothetical protein